jgi:hypothetical protein
MASSRDPAITKVLALRADLASASSVPDQLSNWFAALAAQPLPESLLSLVDQLERNSGRAAEPEGQGA